MFENLSEKLQRAFKSLRGQGIITEENIGDALREIRVALLEADVNLNVVKELVEHIRIKAIGQEVLTALSPAEQVIKIVRDELMTLLGKDTARFQFASRPPTVILMAGLQGSGKTTTSGKLAAWLQKGGHRPMLVSVDVYRPAAREQLKVVAASIKASLYEGDLKGEAPGSALVERLAKEARREAVNSGCDTLIVDTAGRLHIDEDIFAPQAFDDVGARNEMTAALDQQNEKVHRLPLEPNGTPLPAQFVARDVELEVAKAKPLAGINRPNLRRYQVLTMP